MHPVTRLLQAWAKAQVVGVKEDWANGEFTHPEPAAAAMLNAKALAQVDVLQMFVDLDRSQFSEIGNGE